MPPQPLALLVVRRCSPTSLLQRRLAGNQHAALGQPSGTTASCVVGRLSLDDVGLSPLGGSSNAYSPTQPGFSPSCVATVGKTVRIALGPPRATLATWPIPQSPSWPM
jgi:hypothetical protein